VRLNVPTDRHDLREHSTKEWEVPVLLVVEVEEVVVVVVVAQLQAIIPTHINPM
jgi:hypothetical protein